MTLCLKNPPLIPFGLLTDPYFQREVLGHEALTSHSEDAAVIATAAEFIQQLADALKNFGMAMLGAFKEAMDAVADAVEKVVNVINAIVDWIVEQVGKAVSFITEKIQELGEAIANILINIANAIEAGAGEAARIAEEVAKLTIFIGGLTLLIILAMQGIAVMINGNPVIGSLIGGVGALIFSLLFYTVYPKDFLEYGESIISVKDLLVAPADKIYEIDEEAASGYSYVFSAINLAFEPVWAINIGDSEMSALTDYALTFIALMGLLALTNMESDGSIVAKGVLGAVVLAISTYTLVKTTVDGIASLRNVQGGIGGIISRAIFFGLFEFMSLILFLSSLGYMNHVLTGGR